MQINPATISSISADTKEHRARVRQTQVSRLIESSGFGNSIAYVMAVIWTALVWRELPSQVLQAWLGGMSVLFLFKPGYTISVYIKHRLQVFHETWFVAGI